MSYARNPQSYLRKSHVHLHFHAQGFIACISRFSCVSKLTRVFLIYTLNNVWAYSFYVFINIKIKGPIEDGEGGGNMGSGMGEGSPQIPGPIAISTCNSHPHPTKLAHVPSQNMAYLNHKTTTNFVVLYLNV